MTLIAHELHLASGTLVLPKGNSSLKFDQCTFTDSRFNASFELDRGSMIVADCRFENCALFGIQLSGVNVESMSFRWV